MSGALIVIDLQIGVVPSCLNADGVLAATQTVVEKARATGIPIVWVQHSNEHMTVGSSDFEIAAPLQPRPDEARVVKHYRDAFADTNLPDVLTRLNATHLIMCGAQSDYCIRTSVQRAAAEGYDVTLISDCHTTTDAKTEIGIVSARDIIAHTTMYFSGLQYPNQKIKVATSQQICAESSALSNVEAHSH